jgi:hypothetical protein
VTYFTLTLFRAAKIRRGVGDVAAVAVGADVRQDGTDAVKDPP